VIKALKKEVLLFYNLDEGGLVLPKKIDYDLF
jgi:hypothetical protein